MSSEGPPTETAPTQSPAPREVWDEEPKEYLAQDAEYMGPYKRIRKGCTDICMLVVFLALLACNIIWGVVLSTQRCEKHVVHSSTPRIATHFYFSHRSSVINSF